MDTLLCQFQFVLLSDCKATLRHLEEIKSVNGSGFAEVLVKIYPEVGGDRLWRSFKLHELRLH